MSFMKALLQNRSGMTRNLEPEQIIDVDVSAVNYTGDFDSLYIGVSGDVKIKKFNGDVVTYSNIPVGWMPVAGSIVYSSGTGASSIILENFRP